jgi:hypothetical protein
MIRLGVGDDVETLFLDVGRDLPKRGAQSL